MPESISPTLPDDFILSYQIPVITVQTAQPAVDIQIVDADAASQPTVAAYTLAPYAGRIRLQSIKDIIQDYMIAKSLTQRSFQITAGSATATLRVILCTAKFPLADPDTVFLTMLPVQLATPQDIIIIQSTIDSENHLYLTGHYFTDTNQYKSGTTATPTPFAQHNYYARPISALDAGLRYNNAIPDQYSLKAITAVCGARRKTWIVADTDPDLKITFINIFGQADFISVDASITVKQLTDRQTAQIGYAPTLYRQRDSVKLQIKTQHLSDDERRALIAALHSHTTVIASQQYSGTVVITDIDADTDNDSDKEQTVSFTCSPSDPDDTMQADDIATILPDPRRIFNNTYSPPFI